MYRNEILEEIHQYRDKYAQSFQYDLRAIFNDLKRKELAHKDKLVKLPIKRQATTKKD
jgi:rubrerythrin